MEKRIIGEPVDCPDCSVVHISSEQLRTSINEYIDMLDKENCVIEKIYQERLELCYTCTHLYEHTACSICGCFVEIRAKRKDKHCPYPKKPKW